MTGRLAAKPRVARLEKTMFGAGKLSTISGAVAVQMVLFSAIITAPLMERYADSGLIFPVAKRVIDKSCIMMCDKWGPNSCEKWVTRCKGDPGYPKTIRQLERSP